jgi:hypothetical protein
VIETGLSEHEWVSEVIMSLRNACAFGSVFVLLACGSDPMKLGDGNDGVSGSAGMAMDASASGGYAAGGVAGGGFATGGYAGFAAGGVAGGGWGTGGYGGYAGFPAAGGTAGYWAAGGNGGVAGGGWGTGGSAGFPVVDAAAGGSAGSGSANCTTYTLNATTCTSANQLTASAEAACPTTLNQIVLTGYCGGGFFQIQYECCN